MRRGTQLQIMDTQPIPIPAPEELSDDEYNTVMRALRRQGMQWFEPALPADMALCLSHYRRDGRCFVDWTSVAIGWAIRSVKGLQPDESTKIKKAYARMINEEKTQHEIQQRKQLGLKLDDDEVVH